LSDLKITAIWPAGPEHVKKYSTQEHIMFNETQEVYEQVVLPYIESIPAGRISW
jgi:m7GpppX diphosphatase